MRAIVIQKSVSMPVRRYKGLKTKQKRYTRYCSKYEVDWYEEGSQGTHVVHLLVDLKYSSLVAAVSPRSIYEAVG
ncbi:hypothetical protein Tco_0254927 [Tanacetum coccineum]